MALIQDLTVLEEVRQSWIGVNALRDRLQRSAFASVTMGVGGLFPHALADAAHNLPFIHAYSVLGIALKQLADEGQFNCKSMFLTPLLKNSELALPWINYKVVSSGADLRNEVAHRAQLVPRDDCWMYIDAIGLEFAKWGLV